MKKILVIDCGASNCVAHLISSIDFQTIRSNGFSPVRDSFDCFPVFHIEEEITEVYFYGTALKGDYIEQTRIALVEQFPTSKLHVSSDLEAAALSTANNKEGIIHIMGTGSAVCFWDGQKVTYPKVNLGYLWEDYASGYDIGKTIIDYWNEGKLSPQDQQLLLDNEGSITSFIQKVYQANNAKTILAATSMYLDKLESKTRKLIINECLAKYFTKNIDIFADSKEHHFVGSMAYLFREEIEVKMKARKLQLGHIQKDTSNGLLEYFRSQIANHNG